MLGPYREIRQGVERWRVVQVSPDGGRNVKIFATAEEAEGLVVSLEERIEPVASGTLTTNKAIEQFKEAKEKACAWSSKTIHDNGHVLSRFVEAVGNVPLTSLTPHHLRQFIESMSPLALATRRSRFALVAHLLEAGAPEWVRDAEGATDEDGWYLLGEEVEEN